MNVVMNLQVPQYVGNVACFFPGRTKDLSAPLYVGNVKGSYRSLLTLLLGLRGQIDKNLRLLWWCPILSSIVHKQEAFGHVARYSRIDKKVMLNVI